MRSRERGGGGVRPLAELAAPLAAPLLPALAAAETEELQLSTPSTATRGQEPEEKEVQAFTVLSEGP